MKPYRVYIHIVSRRGGDDPSSFAIDLMADSEINARRGAEALVEHNLYTEVGSVDCLAENDDVVQ
jgi:hypothetical protein